MAIRDDGKLTDSIDWNFGLIVVIVSWVETKNFKSQAIDSPHDEDPGTW